MNTKILLGLTLIAVLAMTVVSPAIADAVTGIKKTEVKVKDGEIDKLKFHLDDKVEKPTFGGYAIFTTEGAVVAYTSHATVYDSTSQTAPTSDQVDIQVGAIVAVCGVSPDVACGDEWHSHLVVPDVDSPYCDFAAISELSFNEPADKVKAKGKSVEGKDIAMGKAGFVGAISGQLTDFTVGEPADAVPETEEFDGVSFPLNPAVTGGNLKAICIGESSVLTDAEALCLDLGDGTLVETNAFNALHDVGGDPRTELSEFPYSEDIWDEANWYKINALETSVVGPVELQDWYNLNCVAAP